MRFIGWICIAVSVWFFFPLIQSGRNTSMYLIPFVVPLIIGCVLLKNAGENDKKQKDKKGSKQSSVNWNQLQNRLLSDFPKSYLILACVLLFNNQSSLLTGLFSIPWGTIRSISVLAIMILPALRPFPKRNLYLGLAMIGYGLNSLRVVLLVPHSLYQSGTILISVCTMLVFLAAGVGLIFEKYRAIANRVVMVGAGLFLFGFAMSIMALLSDASDDFQEIGLTGSALFVPGVLLLSAAWMYRDYTCPQFTTQLVSRRNALIALLVVLVIGMTPLRSVLGRSGGYSRPSYSYSYSGSSVGAGGYDMPKAGESFSDYVKRVDPDLYGDMEDRYNSLK